MRLPSTLGIKEKGGICLRVGVGDVVNKSKRLRSNKNNNLKKKNNQPSERKRRQYPWKNRCDTCYGCTHLSARRFLPSEGLGPRESQENSLSPKY